MNEGEIAAGLAQTAGYRYAQLVGSQLFVAGQVPHDVAGKIVGIGDPAVQAVQCLKNQSTLLDVHGFNDSDIQRLVVYVVGDQTALASAWDAVLNWFDGRSPPATLLGVALLGYSDQLVEIDATVIKM